MVKFLFSHKLNQYKTIRVKNNNKINPQSIVNIQIISKVRSLSRIRRKISETFLKLMMFKVHRTKSVHYINNSTENEYKMNYENNLVLESLF